MLSKTALQNKPVYKTFQTWVALLVPKDQLVLLDHKAQLAQLARHPPYQVPLDQLVGLDHKAQLALQAILAPKDQLAGRGRQAILDQLAGLDHKA